MDKTALQLSVLSFSTALLFAGSSSQGGGGNIGIRDALGLGLYFCQHRQNLCLAILHIANWRNEKVFSLTLRRTALSPSLRDHMRTVATLISTSDTTDIYRASKYRKSVAYTRLEQLLSKSPATLLIRG